MLRQHSRRRETFLLRAVALLDFLDLRREEQWRIQEIGRAREDPRIGTHQAGRVEGQTTR